MRTNNRAWKAYSVYSPASRLGQLRLGRLGGVAMQAAWAGPGFAHGVPPRCPVREGRRRSARQRRGGADQASKCGCGGSLKKRKKRMIVDDDDNDGEEEDD